MQCFFAGSILYSRNYFFCMSKRAPWKRQLEVRKDSAGRQIGLKRRPQIAFAFNETNKAIVSGKAAREVTQALRIRQLVQEDPQGVHSQTYWKYLLEHRHQAAEIINAAVRRKELTIKGAFSDANAVEKLRESLADSKLHTGEANAMLAKLAQGAAYRVNAHFGPSHELEVRNAVKEHFSKRRGIPLNTEVFDRVFLPLLGKYKLEMFSEGHFPLKQMEELYVGNLKAERGMRNSYASVARETVEKAFLGRNVPGRVLNKWRKWIVDHSMKATFELFEEAKREVAKAHPNGIVSDRAGIIELQKFMDANINARIEPILSAASARAGKEASQYKLTKRFAESIKRAAKDRVVPKDVASEVKKGLSSRESKDAVSSAVRRMVGQPFDPLPGTISVLREKFPARAALIERLINEGKLSKHSFFSVHNRGELTEKVFCTAAVDPEFVRTFGESKLNILASIISVIGPRGVPISKAQIAGSIGGQRRVAQNNTAENSVSRSMFEFLVRRGYVNTHHHGNSSANLSRHI